MTAWPRDVSAAAECPAARPSVRRPRESPVDHNKQHHAADIACGPTESGDTTGRLRCRQLSQHRVVRDAGQVVARRGEPKQQQARQQIARIVADQAHRRCQQHHHRGENSERLPPSVRCVNPDAGDGGEQCDRDAGEEQRPAEPARRAGVTGWVVTDRTGQVDREHEGHDDGADTGGSAVPQRPREHPQPARGWRGRPRFAHGRPRYSPAHASTRSQRGRPCRRHRCLAEDRRSVPVQ